MRNFTNEPVNSNVPKMGINNPILNKIGKSGKTTNPRLAWQEESWQLCQEITETLEDQPYKDEQVSLYLGCFTLYCYLVNIGETLKVDPDETFLVSCEPYQFKKRVKVGKIQAIIERYNKVNGKLGIREIGRARREEILFFARALKVPTKLSLTLEREHCICFSDEEAALCFTFLQTHPVVLSEFPRVSGALHQNWLRKESQGKVGKVN